MLAKEYALCVSGKSRGPTRRHRPPRTTKISQFKTSPLHNKRKAEEEEEEKEKKRAFRSKNPGFEGDSRQGRGDEPEKVRARETESLRYKKVVGKSDLEKEGGRRGAAAGPFPEPKEKEEWVREEARASGAGLKSLRVPELEIIKSQGHTGLQG